MLELSFICDQISHLGHPQPASSTILGICIRTSPFTSLVCFVPSCPFEHTTLDDIQTHIKEEHNNNKAVTIQVLLFSEPNTTSPPVIPAADDSPQNSEVDASIASEPTDVENDSSIAGGDEDVPDEEDSTSDIPTGGNWPARGRQSRLRVRSSPYARVNSESSSRGGSLSRRASDPFLDIHPLLIPSSPQIHSPGLPAPSPLHQLAFSRQNSKSPPTGDSMDVDVSSSDEATILNKASLRIILLPHLQQLPVPGLLACTKCEHGLVPSIAMSHATSTHHIVFTKAERKAIHLVTTKSIMVISPGSLALPKHPSPPIDGLKQQEGFTCNICPYSCVAIGAMRNHMSDKHRGVEGSAQSNYTAVTVQAFSTQKHSKYFAVVPVLSILADNFAQNYFPKPVIALQSTSFFHHPFLPLF